MTALEGGLIGFIIGFVCGWIIVAIAWAGTRDREKIENEEKSEPNSVTLRRHADECMRQCDGAMAEYIKTIRKENLIK